jgi:hypothetical protein
MPAKMLNGYGHLNSSIKLGRGCNVRPQERYVCDASG